MTVKYVFNPTTGKLDATDKVAFNGEVNLGTAAAPSIFFTGDPNTGIYSPGADQVAISTGGTGRLFVDAIGVGIGTASPSTALDVNGEITLTAGFSGWRTAAIRAIDEGLLRQGTLAFYTHPSSGSFVAPTERLRITSAGLVGIGTAAPRTSLDLGTVDSVITIGPTNASQGLRLGLSRRLNFGDGLIGKNLAGSPGSDGYITPGSGFGYSGIEMRYGGDTLIYTSNASTTAGAGVTPPARLIVKGDTGNVGIGTQSPGATLHVNKASNNLGLTEALRISGTAAAAGDGWKISFYQDSVGQYGYLGSYYVGGASWNTALSGYSNLEFRIADAERARIDSSGRLLVGTATSTNNVRLGAKLAVVGTTDFQGAVFTTYSNTAADRGSFLDLCRSKGTTDGSLTAVATNDALGYVTFRGTDGAKFVDGALIKAEVDGIPGTDDMPGRLVFSTTPDSGSSPVERLRITSGGALRFGQTTTDYPGSGNTTTGIGLTAGGRSGFSQDGDFALLVNRNTSDGTIVQINRQGSGVGSISVTTTATAYNTSSDYRLKENVTAVTDGITRLQQLKPSRFNFIADPDKTVDGFLAHEVQAIVPEAITGEKDAVDDDGNPVYQGIDQSKLVPLLTAALQEAIGEIESLKARVAALESA